MEYLKYQQEKVLKENNNKRIVLVSKDNTFYILRELSFYNIELYQRIQKLNSRNIPKIYSIEEINNHLYIIEEYINSPLLSVKLENNEIKESDIPVIINQLCDVLESLHKLNPPIIHRDIKPENIFYDNGRVVLFDFDISRMYKDNQNKDTVVLGSVGYAAPEQFGFEQSSIRSDIYSLGVLLNVLSTNHLPNEELTTSYYRSVVTKATAIDPYERFNNINDFKSSFNHKKTYGKYNLPGFRKGNRAHMIIAVIGYIFIIIAGLQTTFEDVKYPLLGSIFSIIYYLVTVLYFCNYLNVLTKLTGKYVNKYKRYFLNAVYYCLIFLAFTLLITLISK